MEAVLICYVLEKTTQTQRTSLKRKLYGYKDFSNKGEYTYKRKGALQKIPHIKPHKSVIITNKQHKNKILKILKNHKAKITSYDINIDNKLLS